MTPEIWPKTYLSTSNGKWRVIHRGVPICNDQPTRKDAQMVAVACKLPLSEVYWDGDIGDFQKG